MHIQWSFSLPLRLFHIKFQSFTAAAIGIDKCSGEFNGFMSSELCRFPQLE